jgi:hypothetical protein
MRHVAMRNPLPLLRKPALAVPKLIRFTLLRKPFFEKENFVNYFTRSLAV